MEHWVSHGQPTMRERWGSLYATSEEYLQQLDGEQFRGGEEIREEGGSEEQQPPHGPVADNQVLLGLCGQNDALEEDAVACLS